MKGGFESFRLFGDVRHLNVGIKFVELSEQRIGVIISIIELLSLTSEVGSAQFQSSSLKIPDLLLRLHSCSMRFQLA